MFPQLYHTGTPASPHAHCSPSPLSTAHTGAVRAYDSYVAMDGIIQFATNSAQEVAGEEDHDQCMYLARCQIVKELRRLFQSNCDGDLRLLRICTRSAGKKACAHSLRHSRKSGEFEAGPT